MKLLLMTFFALSMIAADEIVIKELKGGLSGTSIYKLDMDKKSYVLRISSEVNPLELNLSLAASEMGIAPAIASVSSDQKLVLMEFIDHPTLNIQEGKSNIPLLANTLRKVHALPESNAGESLISKASRCHAYLMDYDWTPKRDMEIAFKLIQELDITLDTFDYEAVCLHGDLNPRNIFITNERVLLIDWAESCIGDPFSDLTYLSLKLNFDPIEERKLLEHYLKRPPSKIELARFHLHKRLHLAFWSLTDLYLAIQQNEKIDHSVSLKDFNYYQEVFATGSSLSSQYFYERSMLNLKMALLN